MNTPAPMGSIANRFAGLSGPVRGTSWILISAVCLTAMAATIRYLSNDAHTFIITFFRVGIGLIVMAPWLARTRLQGMKTTKTSWFLARAVVTTIASLGFFYALGEIPLADAVTIMYPPALRHGFGIGFLGVLVMVRPGFEAINLGLAAVFVASIAGAAAAILIRYLSRTESPDTITMYMVLFTGPVMLVLAMLMWETPTWEQIGWLSFIGVIGTFGQRAMSRGYAAADASIILPMDFSRLGIAALFGFMLLAEIPSVYTAIGAALIFTSTVYIARREARIARRQAAAAPVPD